MTAANALVGIALVLPVLVVFLAYELGRLVERRHMRQELDAVEAEILAGLE